MKPIDIYHILPIDEVVFIVAYPTGVMYTAQTGGMMCNHPEVEGFLVSLGVEFLSDFDDCSFGCSEILYEPERQKALSDSLDEAFLSAGYAQGRAFMIDRERINELQEGWWPVRSVLQGPNGGYIRSEIGYIHIGNCD